MDILDTLPAFPYNMCEILFRDSNGSWPQLPQFDQMSELNGYAIGYFMTEGQRGGTGFIIKVLNNDQMYSALVLTAAHIFTDAFQFTTIPQRFLIGQETYMAYPLKVDLTWDDFRLYAIDKISNSKITYPEDWIVCGLRKFLFANYSQKLVPLELAQNPCMIVPNQSVVAYGYPKKPSKSTLGYMAPESLPSDFTDIKHILGGGNNLVYSVGKVLVVDDVICASCASVNGMSGSPLIVSEQGRHKVIGLLHGGPASLIHFLCGHILHFKDSRGLPALAELYSYLADNIEDNAFISELLSQIEAVVLYSENIAAILGDIKVLYGRALSLERNSGKALNYNVFINTSRLSDQINKIINSY